MKAQIRDTFVRQKPTGWFLDDVETEEASEFGIRANFVEEKRSESKMALEESGARRSE